MTEARTREASGVHVPRFEWKIAGDLLPWRLASGTTLPWVIGFACQIYSMANNSYSLP